MYKKSLWYCTTLFPTVSNCLEENFQQIKSRGENVPLRSTPPAGYSISCHGQQSKMILKISNPVQRQTINFQGHKSERKKKLASTWTQWFLSTAQIQNDLSSIITSHHKTIASTAARALLLFSYWLRQRIQKRVCYAKLSGLSPHSLESAPEVSQLATMGHSWVCYVYPLAMISQIQQWGCNALL